MRVRVGVTARPAGCGTACVSRRMPWAVEAEGKAEKRQRLCGKQGGPPHCLPQTPTLSGREEGLLGYLWKEQGGEPRGHGTQAC